MPTATKLLNSKRRVIFQSDRGSFFVKEGDKKIYGVKAVFKKTPKGAVKKMTNDNINTVPLAIRPMKRGAPRGPREGHILRKMNTESRKRTFKIVSRVEPRTRPSARPTSPPFFAASPRIAP